MATKRKEGQPEVTPEVHDYLSNVGKKGAKKGGEITKRLVERGKAAENQEKGDEDEA